MRIGVLHPGNMGAALAACIRAETFWASEGRSPETAIRARDAEIVDVGSQRDLVAAVDMLISVCPPAAALDVAGQVNEVGFDGLYVDLNAVSPATVHQISHLFDRFVDGGIVGPPPSSPAAKAGKPKRSDAERATRDDMGGTRLYISGEEADAVKGLFAGSPVDVLLLGSEPGKASALKMAYGAWTKGASALLLSVGALATSEGVVEELYEEWDKSIPGLREQLERTCARIGPKAWRFVGEMEQIAQSHGNSGLPDGFHLAAADLFARLAVLKDQPPGQPSNEVLDMLLDQSESH